MNWLARLISTLAVLCPALFVLWLLGCEETNLTAPYDEASPVSSAEVEANPYLGGRWTKVQAWSNHVAIHAHLLPDGKVLSWGDDKQYFEGVQHLWDPQTGTSTLVPRAPSNVYCSGHALLPDGRLFVAGGEIYHCPNPDCPGLGLGIKATTIFRNGAWDAGPDMKYARWYPSATTMPNGEVLVISGDNEKKKPVPIPEVWKTGGGWRTLTNASKTLPTYPFMFVAPNGKAFCAGPQKQTFYLDTAGQGAWSNVRSRRFGVRRYGSAVMYDVGKVLVVGGLTPGSASATKTAEIIDLNGSAAWQYTSPMAYARQYLNATLLPDGKVLVTGGTSLPNNDASGAIFAAEIWNPATGKWSLAASTFTRRQYHSIALLLPDGRVLVAGGGWNGGANNDGFHPDAELYSPPYLFNQNGALAARPTITSTPQRVGYGEKFTVQTPEANAIAKVTWIRLGSVTHHFNMNQRINHLSFSKQSASALQVTAPSNRRLAPPGHYMLFLLNGNGVPSIAKIIQIQ